MKKHNGVEGDINNWVNLFFATYHNIRVTGVRTMYLFLRRKMVNLSKGILSILRRILKRLSKR
jgi:hypothetical protein